MIVRELLTLLGFTVDKASYDKAKKAYDSLQGNMQRSAQGAGAGMQKFGQQAQQAAKGANVLGQALGMAQRFAAQAGLSAMVKGMVDMASNAAETSNVLESVFGKAGQKQVEEWAETQGAAMGRSKYSLQQYASQLGAVLGPVTASQDDARRMSESLAQLSVDLGSFFNTTDEEAMRSLRSGLTGEYESLKKYGVVLNETTLQEIAARRGIKKKVSQLSDVEKTELRYAAIMERTKAAQGDAAKTGDGFANASKAVKEALKDLGTDMGKTVLPTVNKFIRALRDTLNWFNKVAKGTNVLEAAMYTLATVAGILAVEFYSAFILPALAIGAMVLLVDDLLTMFRGGTSVIGTFIDAIFGMGAAQEFVANVTAGWSLLTEAIRTAWDWVMKTWGDVGGFAGIQKAWESIGIWFGDWAAKVADTITWPFRKARELLESFGMKFEGPGLQELSYERATGRGMGAGVQTSLGDLARAREQERRRAAGAASGQPGFGTGLQGRQYALGRGVGASTTGAPAVVAAAAAGAGAAGAGPAVVVQSGDTTININGGDEARVRRIVGQALDGRRKGQGAAVGGRGRS